MEVQEVKKLLPTSADWNYELNVIATFLDKDNPEVAAVIIDSIRQSMYRMDQKLADCQAILNGLASATNPESQQEQDLELDNLKEMNDKLQGLAGMLQPQEDTDGTTS